MAMTLLQRVINFIREILNRDRYFDKLFTYLHEGATVNFRISCLLLPQTLIESIVIFIIFKE